MPHVPFVALFGLVRTSRALASPLFPVVGARSLVTSARLFADVGHTSAFPPILRPIKGKSWIREKEEVGRVLTAANKTKSAISPRITHPTSARLAPSVKRTFPSSSALDVRLSLEPTSPDSSSSTSSSNRTSPPHLSRVWRDWLAHSDSHKALVLLAEELRAFEASLGISQPRQHPPISAHPRFDDPHQLWFVSDRSGEAAYGVLKELKLAGVTRSPSGSELAWLDGATRALRKKKSKLSKLVGKMGMLDSSVGQPVTSASSGSSQLPPPQMITRTAATPEAEERDMSGRPERKGASIYMAWD